MQAGYNCCMATTFLQRDECLGELNVLILRGSQASLQELLLPLPPSVSNHLSCLVVELHFELIYKEIRVEIQNGFSNCL